MTTNTEKIIEALRHWPALDDDALEREADVHPRQQVNQICRRLEQKGILRRLNGANGKISNVLVAGQTRASATAATLIEQPQDAFLARHNAPARTTAALARSAPTRPPEPPSITCEDNRSTLFIIPCSGTKEKRSVGAPEGGPSLLNALSPALAHRLKIARDAMRVRAHVDERTLMPAWRRYTGFLYQAAACALTDVEARGLNMLIVSGGYGLVLAGEPIGYYNAVFRLSSWPRGLLEEALVDYVSRHKVASVRAIFSSTGDYRKLLTHVSWTAAGINDAL